MGPHKMMVEAQKTLEPESMNSENLKFVWMYETPAAKNNKTVIVFGLVLNYSYRQVFFDSN